jgi:hypothetical protein
MCTGREFEMNVQQLRQKFESMSLDDLTLVIDEYEDGGWKQAVLNDVIDAKIKAMVAETKDGKLPPTEVEESGDSTLCPPAINSPSTAAFETVVPRDINSTKKHDDVVPQECKPSSPTPARELEPEGKTLQLSIGGGCIRFSNGKAGAVAAHELEKE